MNSIERKHTPADFRLLNPDRGFNAQRSNPFANYKLLEEPSLYNLPTSITASLHALVISPYEPSVISNITAVYKSAHQIKDISWLTAPNKTSINLTSYNDLEKLDDQLKEQTDVYILGALEWLSDIRPMLAWLRKVSQQGKTNIYIIGGLESANETSSYWQWSAAGVEELLQTAGFSTRSHQISSGYFISLKSTNEEYDAFLRTNHLPNRSIKHLIITTEHSGYRVTGGIGSYVKECNMLYGNTAGILIIDSSTDINLETIRSHQWLAAQLFLTENRIDIIDSANFDTVPDLVFEVLQSIVCLYPGIESIEFQEMLAYRTIEAKKLSMIPQNIRLMTVCHGSSFHLAKAKRDVLDPENVHVAYREKFTVEESDTVVFPTAFLRESYRDSGLGNLDDPSRVIRRLPFDYERLPHGKELIHYKRLLYVGKTSTVKGFDLFLGSLIKLYDDFPEICKQLEEVVIVATSTKIVEKYLQDMFRYVEQRFNIRMVSLDREELLRLMAEYSEDTLALITYKGDNHPLAVLEFMAIGLDFLAARAGGTPELIPQEFAGNYLVEPNETVFAEAVNAAFANIGHRTGQIKKLSERYIKDQQEINREYSIDYISSLPIKPSLSRVPKTPPIHLNVIDTGSKTQLEDTLQSIAAQTLPPDTVSIRKLDELDTRDYQGKLVMRLYAGDVLVPSALQHMCNLLLYDHQTGAVLAYEQVPTYLGEDLKGTLEFHPFPPEVGSVFLQEKYKRRFIALFKGDNYIEDNFTDWEKCIKLACQRFNVRIVPLLLAGLVELEGWSTEEFLTNSSRMVHSFTALPTFDAYILYTQLKRFDDIYWGTRLFNHLEDIFIRRDDPTILHGSSPALSKAIYLYRNRTPKFVRISISRSGHLTYRILRRLKKTLRPRGPSA